MRRILKHLFTLLIVLTSFLYCKSEVSNIENSSDEKIFYEIFSLLVEKSYYDLRLLPPFPPTPKYDENGLLIETDSIEIKKIFKKWEERKQNVLADTSRIVILVQDSITVLNPTLGDSLKTIKKLDITKLKSSNQKILFKRRSEFPKGRKVWRQKYSFYLDGILSFGPISLNKEKNEGSFNMGYTKGVLNGSGSKVHVKKLENGKWEITSVVNTWIS